MIDNMFCGETTDVQVFDGQYGTVVGWGYGMYECQDPGAGGTCLSANVKINIQPAVMDEQASGERRSVMSLGTLSDSATSAAVAKDTLAAWSQDSPLKRTATPIMSGSTTSMIATSRNPSWPRCVREEWTSESDCRH